jgi:hypothetical protein
MDNMDNPDTLDNVDEVLINYENDICICNSNNTKLDKLILLYSYLNHNCPLCYPNLSYIDMCKEKTYKEIQNMIKENPKNILYNINYRNLIPLSFVELLQYVLTRDYDYLYILNINKYKKRNKENQMYLAKIKNYIIVHMRKKKAFRYIKKSNHIGNNAKLLQLPYEIWEHIFTFI